MNRDRLQAALSVVLGRIRELGPDGFREELGARTPGDLACALSEIERFASEHLSNTLTAAVAVREAIHWGAGLERPFGLSDLETWIAANDCRFALAA